MSSEKTPDSPTAKPLPEGGVSGVEKPVRRTFPGPRNAEAKLRVAAERSAYADLIAHAKSSLKAEVCGVLAGQFCEDAEGVFVTVEAAIPGTAAGEGAMHVTFTQATWNSIHRTLEKDYPKLKIVGWYHTHPGFGVEFSEMDLFIQRNFFGGPAHIALVTDPLNGDVAICLNTPAGIQYLDRFWVDGREQQCRVPGRQAVQPGEAGPGATPDKLRTLEERVSQLVQALDEMRAFHYRFMLTCGSVFCLVLILTGAYIGWRTWSVPLEPPKVNQVVPVPIQIGDKTVLLGVAITSWQVPPELDAILLQAEMQERAAAAKAAALTNDDLTATNISGTNSALTNQNQPKTSKP